jgi:prepilin-type N-terminal cleavage/methylation domain-containing protein
MKRQSAAGFSLVEMLMTLVIASSIAIGLGTMFSFASELRSRVEVVEAVQMALVDLAALALQVERFPRGDIAPLGDAHVEIVAAATDGEQRFSIDLVDRQLAVIPDQGTQRTGAVDLSAFEAVRFEYLLERDARFEWSDAIAAEGTTILAARIVLDQGNRSWPIVIWSRS